MRIVKDDKSFNFMYRYVYDVLSINNSSSSKYLQYIHQNARDKGEYRNSLFNIFVWTYISNKTTAVKCISVLRFCIWCLYIYMKTISFFKLVESFFSNFKIFDERRRFWNDWYTFKEGYSDFHSIKYSIDLLFFLSCFLTYLIMFAMTYNCKSLIIFFLR